MKKFSWIAALIVALTFVFTGCPEPKKKKLDTNLPKVEVPNPTIVSIGTSGGQTTTANEYAIGGAASSSSAGFKIDFPEEVKGKTYWKVGVELELVEITTPDFISFNAKSDSQMATDVLIYGHTQQYHNELKIGTITDKVAGTACSGTTCLQYTAGTCIVGAKGYAEYPFNKFTAGHIAFQYNPYAGDITTAGWTSSSPATFKIKVNKIVFIPAEGEIPVEPPEPGDEQEYGGTVLKLKLDTVDATASSIGTSGLGTVDIFADETGFKYTYPEKATNTSYENSYATFAVGFPSTDRITNYESVTFTYEGVGGDVGWKSIYLYRGATAYTGHQPNTGATSSVSYSNTGKEATEYTLSLDYTTSLATADTVYFIIAVFGNEASSDVQTSYKISNIKFNTKKPDVKIDIPAVAGVTVPVAGVVAPEVVTATAQYTGSIVWSPTVDDTFDVSTVYTATITLVPKFGFTFTGVEANFFTVAGTSSPATNLVNSGVITAVFPETESTAVEPITSFEIVGVGTIEIDSLIFGSGFSKVEGIEGGIEITGGNYDWDCVKIPITLTGGKTLGDLVSVELDLEGIEGGTTSWKDYHLKAGKPIPGGQITPVTKNDISSDVPSSGNVANGTVVHLKFDVDQDLVEALELEDESVFEITVWASFNNAKFTYTNFVFTFGE